MRKKTIYTILCCLVVFAMACSHEGDESVQLSIDKTNINLTAANGTNVITINTSAAWQVTVSETWLSVTPKSGAGVGVINITAANNNSQSLRTAKVKITTNGKSAEISVNQSGLVQAVPEAGGIIAGTSTNNCPYSNVINLTTVAITGASSYQWYCSGRLVATTTNPVYDATESGAYVVAGKNVTGEGTPGPEKRVTITPCPLPDPAGTISGLDANDCPDFTVTLAVNPIVNAGSYQWYKNGTAIAGATAATYVAPASGTYMVAGVSGSGEGQKSPGKVITIRSCTSAFVRELEGKWDVKEFFIQNSNTYTNNHEMIVSARTPTSIQIKHWFSPETEDVLIATVDTVLRTISIESQEIIPSLNASFRTFAVPFSSSTVCANMDKSFPTAQVRTENGKLAVNITGGTYTVNISGSTYTASFLLLGTDPSRNCQGAFGYTVDTKWIKQMPATVGVGATMKTTNQIKWPALKRNAMPIFSDTEL